jgi:hypothetical protein
MKNLKSKITMKTSNKLAITALLVIFISLFIYDEMLKAEYTSGRYKDPYRNYIALNIKDFDTVNVESSSAANVKFVQGPFSVRINKDFEPFAKFKQKGSCLNISAVFGSTRIYDEHPYIIVISCPQLKSLNVGATYTFNHSKVTDTTIWTWNQKQVLVDGFKQDKLAINQDYGSQVILSNNIISSVNGVIGISKGSGSSLQIGKGNKLDSVKLNIMNRSQLEMSEAHIEKLEYHIADSAKLILNGAAGNSLKNP